VRCVAVTLAAALVACGSSGGASAGSPPAPCPLWQPAATAYGATGDMSYALTDLGAAHVFSIDPAGRITGGSWPGVAIPSGPWDSSFTAGIYTPGSGWSSVPIPEGASFAWPIGIDAAGRVALNVWFPYPFPMPANANPYFERAYAGSPARPLLAPGESASSYATSVANALDPSTGHVVGYSKTLGGAFLYDGATMTPIAVQPGGSSSAAALNRHDQVVGTMWDAPPASDQHAFFWDRGAAVDLGMGLRNAGGIGINGEGLVVGVVDLAGCGMPASAPLSGVFLWDGRTRIIGCPDGSRWCIPSAINSRGDVVGDAYVDSVGLRGFILHDGTFHWLDENVVGANGWSFRSTVAINDTGAIAGMGTLDGADNQHAFLLTPR
jgi:hypothetical protein